MTEFDSYRSYWRFVSSVRRSRYFRTPDDISFLATLYATSRTRWQVLQTGTILYRAQIGNDWRSDPNSEYDEDREGWPCPFPPSRMKPLQNRASEGRVNPKGAAVLYTATHRDTAVAEVRPWVGAYVSVAAMELQRDLTIVNCTEDDRRITVYEDREPEPAEREVSVWRDLDRAFAAPYDPNDHMTAGYAPTQVIAEFFRNEGLHGLGYRSAMGGPGHNIALFDFDALEVVRCELLGVLSVNHALYEAANPYFINSKRKPERED